MTPDEIESDIQTRVFFFLEARGGYVAAASERELIALLRAYGDARAAAERERCQAVAAHRASEWRTILSEQPDSLIAGNRWHEACDIGALISKPDWSS
jgi:hypothetical protein